MPENLPSGKNQPSTDEQINVPETRSINDSSDNSDNSDIDEIASIKGIPTVPTQHSPRTLTASYLAKLIVWAFCLSVGFSFLFATIHYTTQLSKQKEIPDVNVSLEIFKTVSAVMSGPLGFVLGFYFREAK